MSGWSLVGNFEVLFFLVLPFNLPVKQKVMFFPISNNKHEEDADEAPGQSDHVGYSN